MKKIILAMSLAAVIGLVGCDSSSSEPGSTVGSSGDEVSSVDSSSVDSSSEESSSSEVEANWTESELTLMSEHLGDFVIPYMEMGEYELFYNSDWNAVTVKATGVDPLDYNAVMEDAGYETEVDSEDETYFYYSGYHEYKIDMQFGNGEEDFYILAIPTQGYATSEATVEFNRILNNYGWEDYPYSIPTADKIFVVDYINSDCCISLEIPSSDPLALEASYKTLLEDEGAVIDDSVYEDYGYYIISPTGNTEINFYVQDGFLLVDYYPDLSLFGW